MDTVIVVAGRSAARPKPGHRSTAYSDLFSSCARSSAPRLVVPLEASEDDDALLYSARVSAVPASYLALIDSCSERPLRSMPVNLASIVSPGPEERRVGKAGVSPCRIRGLPD